ncbi:MAG: ribosome small subunit-dependent GTPase A [Bacilli bacterium]|nr:ribosome small subunit-dependent GTPase A [Bacilli bacterium]
MKGQIVRIISNLYTVKCADEVYGCRARGKFRNDQISPMVGDNVIIDVDNNVITDILPRKNELKRPVVANVDKAFIIASVKRPELDLFLLDKLISIVTYNNIEPIVIFTKIDLLSSGEEDIISKYKLYYNSIGIKCFYNTELDNIKSVIKDSIVVLCGQTGAGKSSLLNKLDKNLEIKTDEISEALGRGKHTTRHVELYKIGNGYIVDTPGFSSLDLDIDKNDLKFTFVEFNNYDCKFRDCIHDKEIGCGVKKAVENDDILKSRYDNYLLFLKELER